METQATTLEQEVLDIALRIAGATSARFQPLMPAALRSHLVPFFGSLADARVITLGLNPSSGEFASRRAWPLSLTPAEHAGRLVGYWTSPTPGPHPWFRPWSTVLSELGAPYHSSAAHLDLSPRATRAAGHFKVEPLKSLFLEMLQTDAPVWIEALRRATRCSLVLAAGSATKGYYINEFIRDRVSQPGIRLLGDWRRRSGEGQTAMHTLCLLDGRELPLFFCSTGPTRNRGAALIAACRANMTTLKNIVHAVR